MNNQLFSIYSDRWYRKRLYSFTRGRARGIPFLAIPLKTAKPKDNDPNIATYNSFDASQQHNWAARYKRSDITTKHTENGRYTMGCYYVSSPGLSVRIL